MNNAITTLGIVAALAFSLNGEVVAQDGDHAMHQTGDHDAVNREELNREELNHEETNHEEMNHEETNHEEMNHEETNHEEMNHEEMNHEETNHEEMNHEEMNHEETNHEELNHEEMNHEETNHEEMNHEETNHEEMNHEETNHEEMNHEETNHEEMNHEEMNHEEMNHEEMNHEEMNHVAMDHSAMTEMEIDSLRDPHAYSGGYERASGPYSLPSQRQVVLADETTFIGLWMDRFELVDHEDVEGAELEGFAWMGNSYRRIMLQAQIETVEGEVEEGEVDLLYSHAVSPFWNLRAGLHRSFGESADRDWVAIGIKGLAPYWFEVDAAVHIGDNGRTAFDLEVEYELLLTQRLVLQPRIDIKAFSETDIELGRGSGLSTIKTGARLRYEFDRQFAPYLGVERVKRFGETADLLPLGSSRTETHWVVGLRYWF